MYNYFIVCTDVNTGTKITLEVDANTSQEAANLAATRIYCGGLVAPESTFRVYNMTQAEVEIVAGFEALLQGAS